MFEVFDRVFWNYFAIGYLIVGLFSGLSSLFAFTIKEKSTGTVHVACFFVCAALLSFAFCLAHSLYDITAVSHRYFTIIGSIASSTHILQFLLNYPKPAKRGVRYIMLVQWIVTLSVVGYFAYATSKVQITYHFSGHLWDFDAEELSSRVGFVIILNALIYIVFGIVKAIRLKGRERWIVLGLVLSFLSATLIPGILNVLSRVGVMDRDTFTTLFTLISVSACFAVVILFINNTSDRTTFMVKITGISLVTILLVFQMVAYFSLQNTEQSFDDIYRREGDLFIRGKKSDLVKYAYSHRAGELAEKEVPANSNPKVAAPSSPADTVNPASPSNVSPVLPSPNTLPISGGSSQIDFKKVRHEFENTALIDRIAKLSDQDFQSKLDAVLESSPHAFAGYATGIREFVRLEKNAGPQAVLGYLHSMERPIIRRTYQIHQIPLSKFRTGLEAFLPGGGKEFAPFRQVIQEHLQESKSEGADLRAEVMEYLTPAHPPGYRWYRDSSDGRKQFVSYMYVSGNSVTELGFPYANYRAFVHQTAVKIVTVLIGTLIFVLVGFRIFFSTALLTPLEALVNGVVKVNQGDLSVSIQPRVEDEIGFLTRSFNGMVESIREARQKLQEYASSLEEKVKERTAELQETLTQVQSLKTQQDGDYFLTALLLRPLRANRAKSDAVSIEFFQKQKKNFTFRHWNEEIGGDLCMSNNLKLGGRPFIVFMNADAMGKSMQGAGGALVLGSVFEAMLERTHLSAAMQDQFPERWIKNAFIELHKVFEAFECSMMVSLVLGVIDEQSGLLYYINAEHPFSMLYRRGKAAFMDHETYFQKLGSPAVSGNIFIRTFQLEPGDVMIVGSDGRDDILMTSEGREPFMNEDESLILGHVEEAKADLQGIFERLQASGTIIDDLTFIRVGYREAGGEGRAEAPTANEIRNLLMKSQELLKNEKADEATAALESALKLDDRHPEVLKRLALAYVKTKQYEKAAPLAEDYTYLRPGDTEFVYVASYCLKKLRKYDRAADFGERVKLRNPRHVKNLINLAEVYARMGNSSRAEALLDAALLIEPDNLNAKKRLDQLRKAA
ncbi:MAG: SpoIIE family protein phosphatase [Spirochaetia bacterium]|nr:SpoIIE family protein phosphatase [Spirochaetia bacterium]